MNSENRIKDFQDAIENAYREQTELSRPSDWYYSKIRDGRAYAATKSYFLKNDSYKKGFIKLAQIKRLDLTMEAVVVQRFRDIFSSEEVAVCESRLREFGFNYKGTENRTDESVPVQVKRAGSEKESYRKLFKMAENVIAPCNRFMQSKIVEKVAKELLTEKYGQDWKTEEERFWQCFELLSRCFHKDNYTDDVPYFYTMYYMLLNVPKVQLLFLELLKRKSVNAELKVIDIGCCVGTTTIALVDAVILLDNLCEIYGLDSLFTKVTIHAVDASLDNIAVYQKNIQCFMEKVSPYTKSVDKFQIEIPLHKDIEELKLMEKYDLAVVSNVVSEVDSYEHRKRLLLHLTEHLSSEGDIMLIEPASEIRIRGMAGIKGKEGLNRLKKDICGLTALKIMAPCGICDACDDCWQFQRFDTNSGELLKYFDAVYEKRRGRGTKLNKDELHNERAKWGYSLLSLGMKEHIKGTDLGKVPVGITVNIRVSVVKDRYQANNVYSYRVCDSHGNNCILADQSASLPLLKFGDYVELKNVIIEPFSESRKIVFAENSQAEKYYRDESEESFVWGDFQESTLTYFLDRFWGFESFREGQFELIRGALSEKNILGILPTGAGKSICYQLPALLAGGVSIVVSPLKSLIKDQIVNLKKAGFAFVDFVDSSNKAEQDKILQRFRQGTLKLLYVTPERISMRKFQLELQSTLKNINVDYFIIDEAHCASEWGHDFRPAYLQISNVVETITASAKIIAVTATASKQIKKDILEILHIKDEDVVTSISLDRPEISLHVVNLPIEEYKEEKLKNILQERIPQLLHKNNCEEVHAEGAGVVFTIYGYGKGTNTKRYATNGVCDTIKTFITDVNIYHGDLDDVARESIQESYINDEISLLIATKGFGMGIDKPNIRYIVHMCYPNSLEAYYQEAGRAGRDKESAVSIIIARARAKACVLNTRNNELACQGAWQCPYTEGMDRCDYGMQAHFIDISYIDEKCLRGKLFRLYNYLRRNFSGTNKFKIKGRIGDSQEMQKYLFYFYKEDIIKDYYILRYVGDEMEFGIVVEAHLFAKADVSGKIDNIIAKFDNFKRRRFNMLATMWDYVNNTSQCRRQFLMAYFGEEVSYGADGCQFCDIEGVSLEKSLIGQKKFVAEKLFADFSQMLRLGNESLDYAKVRILLEEFYKKKEHMQANVRAMHCLEDFPNNQAALYFRVMIAVRDSRKDEYIRNQAAYLGELLLTNNNKNAYAGFVNEVADYDCEFAMQVVANNKNSLQNKQDVAEYMLGNANDERIKTIIYKSFLYEKLMQLNKALRRRG